MQILRLSDFIKQELLEEVSQYHQYIRGEWWIYKDGTVEFADSDVGELGHEELAVKYLVTAILNAFPDQYKVFSFANELETLSEDQIAEVVYEKIATHSVGTYGVSEFLKPLYPIPLSVLQNDRWASDVLIEYEGAIRVISSAGTVYFSCFQLGPKELHNIYEFLYDELANMGEFDISTLNVLMDVSISVIMHPNFSRGRMRLSEFLERDYKIPGKFWHDAYAK